jgi:TrkA domain protein
VAVTVRRVNGYDWSNDDTRTPTTMSDARPRPRRLTQLDVADQTLPGIGHRYEMPGLDGSRVVVVIHHSGRRDLYVFGAERDGDPDAVVTLTDTQARTLGAILGGAYFKPAVVEEIEAVIGELLIDWLTLRPDSPGAGASIGELQIRRSTGITVAAIVRNHVPLVAPEPTEVLQPGDQLVVIGRQEDLPRFVHQVVDPPAAGG